MVFERKPETFELVGIGSLEVSSEQAIWDIVRNRIKSLSEHDMNTGHRIRMYEVCGWVPCSGCG